jgi:hypothetical protein
MAIEYVFETGTTLTVLMSTITQLPNPQDYINPSHTTKITTDFQSSNAKLATCAIMYMVPLTSSLVCLALSQGKPTHDSRPQHLVVVGV